MDARQDLVPLVDATPRLCRDSANTSQDRYSRRLEGRSSSSAAEGRRTRQAATSSSCRRPGYEARRIVSVSSARGTKQCVDGVVEFSVRAVRGDEFSRAHATRAERRTGTSLVPRGGSSSIDYKVLEVLAVRAGGRGTSRRAQMPGSGHRLHLPTAGPTHVLWRREALPRGAAAARGRVERRIGRLFVVARRLQRSAAARGRGC